MLLLLLGAGCIQSESKPETLSGTDTQTIEITSEPGNIPYAFPIQAATPARTGEYVLSVPRAWIDSAFKDPTDAVFIYYAAKMALPGKNESIIATLTGEKMAVPNSLIIRIPRGGSVKKSDIVLTWWQSGSGMSRAIVVGGRATQPEVLYLDREYNPADAPEKLMPNSFVKIASNEQAGATIACKTAEEQAFKKYQIVNSTKDAWLMLDWTGKMSVMKKADCALLPIIPDIQVGDPVYFPSYGIFDLGTATAIDHSVGRVTVKYQFAGQDAEAVVPFGDIATQFIR